MSEPQSVFLKAILRISLPDPKASCFIHFRFSFQSKSLQPFPIFVCVRARGLAQKPGPLTATFTKLCKKYQQVKEALVVGFENYHLRDSILNVFIFGWMQM